MFLLVTSHSGIIARFGAALLNKGDAVAAISLDAYWRELAQGPELIVLDLLMAGEFWHDVVQRTRDLAPTSKVLAVADNFSEADELALLRLGVGGCCAATVPDQTVARIVDMILDGGVWISNAVLPVLMRQLQDRAEVVVRETPRPSLSTASTLPSAGKLDMLTPREREIAYLVSSGASNKLIARQLDISDRTVKAHLSAIFQKLGIPDRLRLALYVNSQADAVSL